MRVAVIYGGASVEHDVSILTALQAMDALSVRHTVIPVYMTRGGRWLTGERLRDVEAYRSVDEPDVPEASRDVAGGVLRVQGARQGFRRRAGEDVPFDVALPAAHGTFGEDGCLQGLLEVCGVPYAGSGVAASAIAMDKGLTKGVLRQAGLPVVDGTELTREDWRADPAGRLAAALGRHPLPVYVKPASLGSSIGVSRCASREEAEAALELAFELDTRVLIETGIDGGREVNCAVLGPRGGELRASVCEQPVSAGDLLSFEDKYLHGAKTEGMKGAERIIPAPIDAATTARVQELATRAFAALGCAGVARVDFLIGADGSVYVNELNTIPGSFSFYLWEPVDVHFPDLLDAVLGYALAEHERGRSVTRTFPSTLLSEGRGGAKTG